MLGLGGLVGAGRSELARILFGADRPDSGEMTLEGQALCAEKPGPSGKGGDRICAGGATRRGPHPVQERRSQSWTRELNSIVISPMLPLISGRRRRALAEAHDQATFAIKRRQRRYAGRTAERRQSTESRHRTMAAIEAEGAHSRRADARRRRWRARRNPQDRFEGWPHEGMAVLVISSDPEELAGSLRPRADHGGGAHRRRARGRPR